MACNDHCTEGHCSAAAPVVNESCKRNGWGNGVWVPVFDPNTGACCLCACSCAAYDTPVAIGKGQTKPIQLFELGDPVLARENGQWVSKTVKFSNGTSSTSIQPEMCYITYELNGEEQTIVVTLDHTFLTPGNKLIRADQLMAGSELQVAAGGITPILKFEVNSYEGGIWNIATSDKGVPTSLEGHLIDTQGLISGDYAVQLFFNELSKQGLAVSGDLMPHFNTEKYVENLKSEEARIMPAFQESPPEINLANFLAAGVGGLSSRQAAPGEGGIFLHLDYAHILQVPEFATNTQGYLTTKQAAEVKIRDSIVPASVPGMTDWLFTLFHAFYPEINFILDLPNQKANAFALRLSDQMNVLMQGGLVRAKQLGWEGTALILGYLVDRLLGEPDGSDGFTCKPVADFNAVGRLINVFNPLYFCVIPNALQQITDLFDSLKSKEDDPVGDCHSTTLDCRIETYKRAMQYLPLPECAGGPAVYLKVTGAQGEKNGKAVVEFNDSLDIEEASDAKNYQLDPKVELKEAQVITPQNDSVRLIDDFTAGKKYKVTVSNVRSVGGLTLDPEANSASFTIPK